MTEPLINLSLDELIAGSLATPGFTAAVHDLARGGRSELIDFNPGAPPVKVLRVLKKILETYPDLPIERARIQGVSGCANFVGQAIIQPGGLTIAFDWDCRWQAQQLGWHDPFGAPDQIRAARQLDYQCFKRFEAIRSASLNQ